jgi:hypothetical protein
MRSDEYDTLVSNFNSGATRVTLINGHPHQEYTVVKLGYGDASGYRMTELTYPGDLITNIGDSLTSMLDKIKGMLGDFEYFYDVDGRFVF